MMIRLPIGEEGYSDWSGFIFLLAGAVIIICLMEMGLISLFILAVFKWKNFFWQIAFGLALILFPLLILCLYRRQ